MNYTIITRKKQGRRHRQLHKPCQDSLAVRQEQDYLLLAVADGHGGDLYTRSGLGARIACQAAGRLTGELTDGRQAAAAVKEQFDHLVDKHLAFRPLAILEKLPLHGRPAATVYGTTLLAAVVRQQDTIVYQMGDGGLYLLGSDGRFLDLLEEDEDCVGSVTSSMAYPTRRYMEHVRVMRYEGRPAAMLLFTDGFDFSSLYPWQAACLLREPGRLETALDQLLAQNDHGDDQTFLLAFDPDQIATPAFLEGLDREEDCGRRHIRLAALQREYQQRRCWLELAAVKGKRMQNQAAQSEEFSRFKQLIQRRFVEYEELRRQIEALRQGREDKPD